MSRHPISGHGSKAVSQNYTQQFQFFEHMLRSLKMRSQSNTERLRNEINLVFNTVAQYDSKISVQIGQAAQMDSSAMRTISLQTLIFLPATFISVGSPIPLSYPFTKTEQRQAIFSTSFFNFTPATDTSPAQWRISEKFWVFWAIAVPLTVVTICCWLFWHRFFPYKPIGLLQEEDTNTGTAGLLSRRAFSQPRKVATYSLG